MGEVILVTVSRELALYGIGGTAGAVAVGVAALSHKVVHYAVEGQTVIETVGDKLLEVLAGLGSYVGVHCDNKASGLLSLCCSSSYGVVSCRMVGLILIGAACKAADDCSSSSYYHNISQKI